MISNTSSVPTLAGGFITLDMVKRATDEKARRTKIICTLGPACWDVDKLESMLEIGMNVARFNFSHGDHEGHGACLERLRTAAKNKNKNCGTLQTICLRSLRSIFVAIFVTRCMYQPDPRSPTPLSLITYSCSFGYQGTRDPFRFLR